MVPVDGEIGACGPGRGNFGNFKTVGNRNYFDEISGAIRYEETLTNGVEGQMPVMRFAEGRIERSHGVCPDIVAAGERRHGAALYGEP